MLYKRKDPAVKKKKKSKGCGPGYNISVQIEHGFGEKMFVFMFLNGYLVTLPGIENVRQGS